MKVIGWIGYDEIEDGFEQSFGCMGGFFDDGMRWKDYIDLVEPEYKSYAEALRKEIIEKGIRYNGSQHQNMPDGIPVFSDGTYALFSYRGWGDIMAAIWSEHEDTDYCYMDFYCCG